MQSHSLLRRPAGEITLGRGCAFGKVEISVIHYRRVSIKEAILRGARNAQFYLEKYLLVTSAPWENVVT